MLYWRRSCNNAKSPLFLVFFVCFWLCKKRSSTRCRRSSKGSFARALLGGDAFTIWAMFGGFPARACAPCSSCAQKVFLQAYKNLRCHKPFSGHANLQGRMPQLPPWRARCLHSLQRGLCDLFPQQSRHHGEKLVRGGPQKTHMQPKGLGPHHA